MAYDEGIAQRLREAYQVLPDIILEKRMFGGIVFMVNGYMSCGVNQDRLMVRVGPESYQYLLKHPYAREMDFTGKPLKGFLYIDSDGFESDKDLLFWIQKSFDYLHTLPPK